MNPQSGRATAGEHLSVRVEGAAPADWDPFLATANGATFCHLAGWSRLMDETLGHELLDDPAAPTAQRDTDGDLPLATLGPNEQEIGHIGARDQQDEPHGAE